MKEIAELIIGKDEWAKAQDEIAQYGRYDLWGSLFLHGEAWHPFCEVVYVDIFHELWPYILQVLQRHDPELYCSKEARAQACVDYAANQLYPS